MDFIVEDLKLFYSKDHKKWHPVKIFLSKDKLLFNAKKWDKEISLWDVSLEGLRHWEENKSVFSFKYKDGKAFFIGGKKEVTTSLFLKVTQLQFKRNKSGESLDKPGPEIEWFVSVTAELVRELNEKVGKSDTREILRKIGLEKGARIAEKYGTDTLRGALNTIIDEISQVFQIIVHSSDYTETEVVFNIEIPKCGLVGILKTDVMSHTTLISEILSGIIEQAMLDMTAGRSVQIDHWKSDIEDTCFAKITVLLPEEWSDESTEDKYWKD